MSDLRAMRTQTRKKQLQMMRVRARDMSDMREKERLGRGMMHDETCAFTTFYMCVCTRVQVVSASFFT